MMTTHPPRGLFQIRVRRSLPLFPLLVFLAAFGCSRVRAAGDPASSPPAGIDAADDPDGQKLSALICTRFWHPWRSTSWPHAYFYFSRLASDDGGVWVSVAEAGAKFTLFRVDLPDFTTRIIPMPDQHQPQNLVAMRDALYMTWETHGHDNSGKGDHQIARYDLPTGAWATHDLPAYLTCELFGLGNSLYLFLQNEHAANASAITRYDWAQDKLTFLASTRRRPAQNQFDDRQGLLYAKIFSGPDHRPCVTTQEGTFYIQEKPGPWPEVFDGSFANQVITSEGKTLVLDQHGEATLFDPDQSTPEYWMASTEPRFRKRGSPGSPAVKEPTPWAAQAIWDLPKNGTMWYPQTCFHDDGLFILNKPKVKGGPYDLLCYQKGKGRDPWHIPLEFQLDDKSRAVLSVVPEHAPVTWNFNQIEHPDTTIYPGDSVWFYATKQGLYIQPNNVGFWFLPYGDIDAYLKAAQH